MDMAFIWIYTNRIKVEPQRRHVAKGHFRIAFSDVRRLTTNAALPKNPWIFSKPTQSPENSSVSLLLRMVA